MNKFLHIGLCLVLSLFVAQAQTSEPYIRMKTDATFGSSFSFVVKPTTKSTLRIDWGNGKVEEKTVDPNGFPFERKISTSVQGKEVTIYGSLQELECTDLKISGFSSQGQSQLKRLDLSRNMLTKEELSLEGLTAVEDLSLNENQIAALDVRTLVNLVNFNINKNSTLGSVVFPAGSTKLKQISMSDGDISHFYPISLPALSTLNLSNNALLELEIGENYPALSKLNIEGNQIAALDVTHCSKLSMLNISKNKIASLDIKPCKELVNLFCAENQLTALNVTHNTQLTNIDCAKNNIKSLDVSKLTYLSDFNASNNPIGTLDFSKNMYLKTLRSAGTQISVLNLRNNNRLRLVDVRDNVNMTSCSINFMFSSMWACNGNSYSANLLIKGSNGEHADKSTITSEEYKWILDISPDGSANCQNLAVTLTQKEGGKLTLIQEATSGDNDTPITTTALAGAPIRIQAEPLEGYKLAGVKVNGKVITEPLFIISQASTIEPVWSMDTRIVLGTKVGQPLSFALGATTPTDITIDWGDGNLVNYTIDSNNKRLENNALGQAITISGDVAYADFASYPGMEIWDNQFTSADLGKSDKLTFLSLYMNPIKQLNVTGCTALTHLDCAYTDIAVLDVKANTQLTELLCYGNKLAQLDLKQNTQLVKLEARHNLLKAIDLKANTLLKTLDLQVNALNTLDVKAQTLLETLKVDENQLASIDLSANTQLLSLSVSKNQLTELNLKPLTKLLMLYCGNNKLKTLDLGANKVLTYLNCVGNGFSACTLNDIYFSLPQHIDVEGLKLADNFTLRVTDANTTNANDATHAESVLATIKGWKINQEGDGKGCTDSYVIVEPSQNGALTVTANNQTITSGTKVKKETVLTLTAQPANGFYLKEIRINGTAISGKTHKVTAAAFIQAIFEKGTSIEEVQRQANYTLAENRLMINRNVKSYALFAIDGTPVQLQGYEAVLPAGAYILRLVTEEGTATHKILVP